MYRIQKNLFLYHGSKQDFRSRCDPDVKTTHVLLDIEETIKDEKSYRPIPLQQIGAFCTKLSYFFAQTSGDGDHAVVVCSGDSNDLTALTNASSGDGDHAMVVCSGDSNDLPALTNASLLLGSYLILHWGETCSAVSAAFGEVCGMFVPYADASSAGDRDLVTVHDCWQALDHAVRLGWFVHPSSDAEPLLDIDELTHYASVANGAVHLVIPGSLVFFPTPSDDLISDGRDWAESETAAGRTVRRFSPGFYASLLADLGVSAVACLGSGSCAASLAFSARGIATMDLAQAAPLAFVSSGEALAAIIRALDRLLALADAKPGVLAMHSGAGAGWPEAVGTLAAAFLVRRLGFSGGGAVAWLHMVAPWMLK